MLPRECTAAVTDATSGSAASGRFGFYALFGGIVVVLLGLLDFFGYKRWL
jgi:hypothetical protein